MPRLCLLAILLVAGCRPGSVAPPSGDVAGALALPTTAGDAFDPAQLRGKPAIVMFWRTGCSYCMNELPVVAEVAREKGASAVAVLVAGDRDAAARIAETWDGTVLVDDGTLRDRYAIRKVPYTLILRPDGTAARAFLGEQSGDTLAGAVSAAR